MADIFVSYKREDRDRVASLVRTLESAGFSVWWDSAVLAGDKWKRRIKAELDAARCVLVVWTSKSIRSDGMYASEWIEKEAGEGYTKGVLVPALFDPDAVPWEHNHLQYVDLTNSSGSFGEQEVTLLTHALQSAVGKLDVPLRSPALSYDYQLTVAKSEHERAFGDGDTEMLAETVEVIARLVAKRNFIERLSEEARRMRKHFPGLEFEANQTTEQYGAFFDWGDGRQMAISLERLALAIVKLQCLESPAAITERDLIEAKSLFRDAYENGEIDVLRAAARQIVFLAVQHESGQKHSE